MIQSSNRIHLLFFTQIPIFGGGEQYLVMLLNGLPSDTFSITCMCTNKETLTAIQHRVSRTDIKFVLYDIGTNPSIWKTVWPLQRYVSTLHPQIVHCNSLDGYGGAYIIMASKLAGVPVILGTFHASAEPPLHGLLQHLFGFVVDKMLDGAIVVSRATLTAVEAHRYIPIDRLSIVYNGVPISKINKPITTEEHVRLHTVELGTVGRLAPSKDIGTLLKAVSIMSKDSDKIHLTIVGDGNERNRLLQLSRQLGIDGVVEFAGWRDPILSSLQSFDVFILSSVSEGCPLVILEAMTCGLPVVATSVGGIPEIVISGETAILVPSRDPEALADAIRVLVRNPEMRRRLGIAGYQQVITNFSVERMITETIQIYEHLLNKQCPQLG